MERVTEVEVNTDREKCDLFNRFIDNLNQLEGKLLTMIAKDKEIVEYNEAVAEYNGEPIQKGGE
ncbi:hypothetical protein LCGC14_0362080 [marine sediment metagenome]|uniref:Uncharacterized protein n=1 Tax=marine sediment metagenome TaxID=412755 RepID=A0A0F9T7P0_9ZZZZ